MWIIPSFSSSRYVVINIFLLIWHFYFCLPKVKWLGQRAHVFLISVAIFRLWGMIKAILTHSSKVWDSLFLPHNHKPKIMSCIHLSQTDPFLTWSYCHFYLHFSFPHKNNHNLICLLTICIFSSENHLLLSFANFFIVFFLLFNL